MSVNHGPFERGSYRDRGGHDRPETAATVPEPAAIRTAQEIRPLLAHITDDAQSALKDNLVSLLMYGSYPRGEARASSDVNIMLVVKQATADKMNGLLSCAQAWTEEGAAAPVVIAEREFAASQDTLALEYLDIAAARQVLAGKDLFAEFAPDWALIRLALEQEARRKAIILMKRWLASAGNGRDARRIIADMTPGYVALLRGMVLYERRAVEKLHATDVLGAIGERQGLHQPTWGQIYKVGKEYARASADELMTLVGDYINQSQKLVDYLDKLDGTRARS